MGKTKEFGGWSLRVKVTGNWRLPTFFSQVNALASIPKPNLLFQDNDTCPFLLLHPSLLTYMPFLIGLFKN